MQKSRSIHKPKLAIVRTSGIPVRSGFYNFQEVGLAKAVAKEGWSCDVFTASPTKKFYVTKAAPSVRVFHLPYYRFLGDQGVFPGLLTLLRQGEYQIVQVQEHWQYTSITVAREVSKWGIPVILGQGKYHDNVGPRRVQIMLMDALGVPVLRKSIKYALCKTKAAADYLRKKGFTKITVLPIGLDTDRFAISYQKSSQQSTVFRLLYVGNIQKPKQVPFLVELMDYLLRQGADVKLQVVGDGRDIKKCVHIAKERNLSDRVEFVGKVMQSDLPRHYIQADCLLLPTYSEIYGMVLLEAMYFGLPVIASHAAGPDDIVSPGVDGYLMKGFNINDWAEAVLSLINDPDKHKMMSEATKKKIRERLTWDALAPRYAEFYESLLR